MRAPVRLQLWESLDYRKPRNLKLWCLHAFGNCAEWYVQSLADMQVCHVNFAARPRQQHVTWCNGSLSLLVCRCEVSLSRPQNSPKANPGKARTGQSFIRPRPRAWLSLFRLESRYFKREIPIRFTAELIVQRPAACWSLMMQKMTVKVTPPAITGCIREGDTGDEKKRT